MEFNKPKKKKGKGCLVVFIVIILLGALSNMINKDDVDKMNDGIEKVNQKINKINETETKKEQISEKTDEISAQTYKDFDDKSWADFLEIHGVWQNYVNALNNFAEGDQLNSYTSIKEYESYFRSKSVELRYGETEEFKDYLSVLSMMCIDAQLACKNTLKYIDNKEMKFLSEAQGNISKVKEDVNTFASNRGMLLVKAGYSEEEINAIIENATTEMGQ